MKISLMRNIDRYAGVPLCWMSGLIRRMFVSATSRDTEVHDILIIKFFGMGSIIQTTPAIQILRNRLPQARIVFVSFEIHRDLLARYILIDKILTIDHTSPFRFLRDTVRTIMHLLRNHYDVVFDFEFFSKFSTLLSACSSAPQRIGFSLPTIWRRLNLTHQIELTKSRHVSRAFCEQVFLVTGEREVPPPAPPLITQEDFQTMEAAINMQSTSVIAVNVNAGRTFLERRWKPELFAELVTSLAHEHNWRFYFIGSTEERPYVQQIIDNISDNDRCYNIAGMLSVPQLAAFFTTCEILISNDSGPLHLADVVGTRVIGLFGPESPSFYGPLGSTSTTLYKSISCSPCMNVYAAKLFKCPFHARCMNEIGVDEVQDHLTQHHVVR